MPRVRASPPRHEPRDHPGGRAARLARHDRRLAAGGRRAGRALAELGVSVATARSDYRLARHLRRTMLLTDLAEAAAMRRADQGAPAPAPAPRRSSTRAPGDDAPAPQPASRRGRSFRRARGSTGAAPRARCCTGSSAARSARGDAAAARPRPRMRRAGRSRRETPVVPLPIPVERPPGEIAARACRARLRGQPDKKGLDLIARPGARPRRRAGGSSSPASTRRRARLPASARHRGAGEWSGPALVASRSTGSCSRAPSLPGGIALRGLRHRPARGARRRHAAGDGALRGALRGAAPARGLDRRLVADERCRGARGAPCARRSELGGGAAPLPRARAAAVEPYSREEPPAAGARGASSLLP